MFQLFVQLCDMKTDVKYFLIYLLHLGIGCRYYELKPDDPPYAAKFYDCCGAEDPEALGCTTSFHVSYDDDWLIVVFFPTPASLPES